MASLDRAALTRKERAELTRQRILDVAVDRFSRQPFNEVSIADLARSADVAHGLLFFHFQNKRNLYLESMREVARQLSTVHEVDAPSDEEPGQRVWQMLVRHLEYMANRRDLARSIISGGISADPEARAIFEADRWKISHWFLTMIGLNPDNPALRLMVQSATGATDAATLHWIRGGCLFPKESVASNLLDILVTSLHGAHKLDPQLDVSSAVQLLQSQ